MRPGNYYCNSSNVIYLIKCKKCDSGNYIGETSTFFRLRMNNHKKSIRNNNKGLTVARQFNIPGRSICDLECVILKGDFSNKADRLIEEQTLIHKLNTDTHGLIQDLDFLAPYSHFHRLYTSTSTKTPLTFDLHLRTVATLTSLTNVPLLTDTLTSDVLLPPPSLP